MNLREITIKICEELSDEKTTLDPMSIELSGGVENYYGFKPKKKFHLFRQPPVFQLTMQYGKPTLISFVREYDKKIEEIAKKEDFAYNFSENRKFTLPAKAYL